MTKPFVILNQVLNQVQDLRFQELLTSEELLRIHYY